VDRMPGAISNGQYRVDGPAARVCFRVLAEGGVSGLPDELWSFVRESRVDGPALHSEARKEETFMFLLLLDFRLPLVGRFRTLVIWLKRR